MSVYYYCCSNIGKECSTKFKCRWEFKGGYGSTYQLNILNNKSFFESEKCSHNIIRKIIVGKSKLEMLMRKAIINKN